MDQEISKVSCYFGPATKVIKKLHCTEFLSVQVAVDVSFELTATVNLTGIPDKEQYTAYVKLSSSSSWQFSN